MRMGYFAFGREGGGERGGRGGGGGGGGGRGGGGGGLAYNGITSTGAEGETLNLKTKKSTVELRYMVQKSRWPISS